MDAKLDRNTQTAIGKEFFGDRMRYVDSIIEIDQESTKGYQIESICSMEHLFNNLTDMIPSVQIYNTLAFALLCREQKGKYTDIENEFRIITYDTPKYENGCLVQKDRNTIIHGKKSGISYTGVLTPGKDTVFSSNTYTLRNPVRSLREIVFAEEGAITIDSEFKSIDLNEISDDYAFIGNKAECAAFIREMTSRRPKEKYINRTISKKYKIDEIDDALFARGYYKVRY